MSMAEDDNDTDEVPIGGFRKNGLMRTGFPPGNPNHVGPNEAQARRDDVEAFGQAEAAKRAHARWEAYRQAKGGRPPGASSPKSSTSGTKTNPKGQSSEFASSLSGAIPPAPKDKPVDIKGLSQTVMLAHVMLAMKLERADFAINEDEAYMLTKAVADLLDYYGIKLKGKASAWSALIYAVTMIYGTRVAAIVIENMKKAKS